MNLLEQHVRKTQELLKLINKNQIADWILTEGYFPEQYVLPPSFKVNNFSLKNKPYNKDLKKLSGRQLISISYPKTTIVSRVFSIIHPWNYHDIVFYIMEDWNSIIKYLFPKNLKIFSYGFPIPVSKQNIGGLSPLRSGRMIYEWVEMAEKDLVAESHKYSFIIRTDVTNFYNSIYTHSISWALHGRDKSLKDDDYELTGSKIDRLFQYSNDRRTNGISVGPVISDLVAEIILISIDKKVSESLKDLDFIGTRFKDDYRILCKTQEEAKLVLKTIAEKLKNFDLLINENKTRLLKLPEGLYRDHDREYFQYSLRNKNKIPFKLFEQTLLIALSIHKKYPATSLLEKFLSEIYDNNYELKIAFSKNRNDRKKQILKTFGLLFLLKRESEKILGHILAIIEQIYLKYNKEFKLKEYLKKLIFNEIERAVSKESVFELTWLIFFSRYMRLGIKDFKEIIKSKKLKDNQFVKSIIESTQKIFNDSLIKLFIKPKDCHGVFLSKRLAVFNRSI